MNPKIKFKFCKDVIFSYVLQYNFLKICLCSFSGPESPEGRVKAGPWKEERKRQTGLYYTHFHNVTTIFKFIVFLFLSQAQKAQREQSKQDHEKKKEKDKQDRDAQKQKQQQRKEKEKTRTQKQEKRR